MDGRDTTLGRHGFLTIVGQGLVGTVVALEAERRGRDFVVVDLGAGATATRAAAGLFNPLTGPRFSPTPEWDRVVPFYTELEQTLGVALVRLLPLVRPLATSKTPAAKIGRSAPGWSARIERENLVIDGGGWVDVAQLVDAARRRWLAAGRLEERWFGPEDGRGRDVVWCGGISDFGPVWGGVPGIAGSWQAVRGDVLTVRVPGLDLEHIELGDRFLVPLGGDGYRWGATHESDVDDQGFRSAARRLLEDELRQRLGPLPYEVLDHAWGVRPASRNRAPLRGAHPDEPGWQLINGYGGRGVALVPRLRHLFADGVP